MSNLPPGVTGNELEIAGPAFERDEYRECTSEGFTIKTITLYGEKQIEEAVESLNSQMAGNLYAVVAKLRTVLSDIATTDVDGECPFAGDVTVWGHAGITHWQCPVCRVDHEEELDDE